MTFSTLLFATVHLVFHYNPVNRNPKPKPKEKLITCVFWCFLQAICHYYLYKLIVEKIQSFRKQSTFKCGIHEAWYLPFAGGYFHSVSKWRPSWENSEELLTWNRKQLLILYFSHSQQIIQFELLWGARFCKCSIQHTWNPCLCLL